MPNTLFYLLLLAAGSLPNFVQAYDCSLPLDNGAGTCGSATRCAPNVCCSKYGFCGTDATYCDATAGCQSDFGMCGNKPATCDTNNSGGSTSNNNNTSSSGNRPKCPSQKSPIITNFYPTWQSSSIPIYSDVSFYFAAVTTGSGFSLDGPSTKALPAWITKAKKQGKASLTIGGWGGSLNFSSLVSTTAKRSQFASDIAAYVKKYNLDGVDFDWEYPGQQGVGCNQVNAQDTQNFLALLKVVRSALDKVKSGLLMTADVPINTFIGSDGNPVTDVSGFAQVLDYITLMAYDVYGSWTDTTGPVSPLYSKCSPIKASGADAVSAWTAAGFPACRLLLGVPSYGYAFTTLSSTLKSTGSGATKSQMYQAKSSVVPKGDSSDTYGSGGTDLCGASTAGGYAGTWNYNSLIAGKVLSSDGTKGLNGFTRYYDTCSETPFLFNPSKKYFITYEDSTSIAKKAAFAKSKGLAGISVYSTVGWPSSMYQVIKKNL